MNLRDPLDPNSLAGSAKQYIATFSQTVSSMVGDLTLGYANMEPANYIVTVTNVRPKDLVTYKRRITNLYRTVVVKSLVQSPVDTYTDSNWQAFSASFVVRQATNALAQATFGVSVTNGWMSRRIWAGTTPITLNLKLNFTAVNNPLYEVYLPILELQRMVLPYTGSGMLGALFLTPPGPNPFTAEYLRENSYLRVIPGIGREGENVSIEIGKAVRFDNVILKKVNIVMDDKFTEEGFPVSASALITFETFEIMTKEGLDAVYPLR
jgi:hypothetical protein